MDFETWLKRKKMKGEFGKNVVMLASGTALGQAIVIMVTPLLTRLYTPEQFGALSVYSSVLGILLPVISLRYDIAVPLPKLNNDAKHLFAIAIGICFVISTIVASVIMITGRSILNLFHMNAYIMQIELLPIGLFFGGVYQAFNYMAVRRTEFARISKTKLVQGASNAIVSTILGFLGFSSLGLIVGNIFGASQGIFTLRKTRMKEEKITIAKSIRILRRYWKFPLVSAPSGLANSMGLFLPGLIIASFYGETVSGWYGLSQRLLVIPVSLIGSSIAQVYYSRAAAAKNDDPKSLNILFITTLKKLVSVGIPCVSIVGFAGYFSFPILFGKQWSSGAIFVLLMLPMYIAQFSANPLSQTLNVIGRQDIQLVFDIIRVLLTFSIFYLFHYFEIGYVKTILCYSLFFSIMYIGYIALSFSALKVWIVKSK